jgi:hypothetical protein
LWRICPSWWCTEQDTDKILNVVNSNTDE